MAKALIRSMNRRGSRSDKSPPVARKQKFSDPSICDRFGAVYSAKTWQRSRWLAPEVINKARWVECPGCAELEAARLERAIGVVYRPESELMSHYFQACLP